MTEIISKQEKNHILQYLIIYNKIFKFPVHSNLHDTMQELNNNIQRLNTEYYRKRVADIELKTYQEGWSRAGRYLEAAVDLPEEWRILDMAQKVIAGIQMMSDDIKTKIFHSLAEGYTLGESIPKLARRIREISDSNRYRAIRFARTTTNSVYNQAHIDRYQEAGIKYIQYHAQLDSRTSPICQHLHGTIWREGDSGIISPPAHWNSYYPGTEILTEDGFKKIEDITEHDLYASLNPVTKEIEYVRGLAVKRWHDGQMIRIRNHRFDLCVTPDHQIAYVSDWKYKRDYNSPILLKDAKDLKSGDRIPRTGKWVGKNIPVIIIGENTYDTIDFVRFLGWYISEGHVKHSWNNHYSVIISQAKYKDEVIEVMEHLFPKVWVGQEKVGATIDKEFYDYLHRLGYSYEKYIPQDIKELSPEYLRVFLDAFNLGDGSIQKVKEENSKNGGKWNGNFKDLKQYFTSSKQLADDICELILKCGNLPSYRNAEPPGRSVKFRNGIYITKHPVYKIYELHSKNLYFKHDFMETFDYKGYVYCVSLERNHIVYVRYNGKCCWSGNCRSRLIPWFRGYPGDRELSDDITKQVNYFKTKYKWR